MLQNLQVLIKNNSDKIRFVAVGGTNTVIDFSILFTLTNLLTVPVFWANIISTSVALTFSFFANKKFTFKDNANNKAQMPVFLVITLLGLWVIQPIIIALVDAGFSRTGLDNNIILLIGKLMATCVTLVWNYVLYKKFVFKITE